MPTHTWQRLGEKPVLVLTAPDAGGEHERPPQHSVGPVGWGQRAISGVTRGVPLASPSSLQEATSYGRALLHQSWSQCRPSSWAGPSAKHLC